MMLYRGIELTYESIRDWFNKFSLPAAKKIKKRRAKANDNWHLDEVRVKIRGQIYWLWQAVDDEGIVLDILIQKLRHTKAKQRGLVASQQRATASRSRQEINEETSEKRRICSQSHRHR